MNAWLGAVPPEAALAAVILAVLVGVALLGLCWGFLASKLGVSPKPRSLVQPWVIDGDTIDDAAAGIRYRLANIDAPETGDHAKCYREAERGQLAKWAAIRLVREAAAVTARPTGRMDRYGRCVAFILVDGADLGNLLVGRGLALPWRGRRERWCGANGGLARIAARGGPPHACQTCRHWP
jgi:hypothetical protein